MIPIAELRYDLHASGSVDIPRGTLVFVLGYIGGGNGPKAIIMHPKLGWYSAELYNLMPRGFRTHVGALP